MYSKTSLIQILASVSLITSTSAVPSPNTRDLPTLKVRYYDQLSTEVPTGLSKRYSQSQKGDLAPGTFPETAGTQLCLCNDFAFGDCMCVADVNDGAFGLCLSNRGSSGPWSGFKNNAISSVALTGGTPATCNLYVKSDCNGSPALVLNSAGGADLRATVPASFNDRMSSFVCDRA